MEDYWTKIPKQKYLRGNEEGIKGDCWRCCIAAIINKPANEVPHFLQECKSIAADTQKWLNDHGFAMISIEYGGWVCCPQWAGEDRVRAPIMECGPTVRSESKGSSENHCVVTMNSKLVYDPHPSEAGLLATTDYHLIVPIPDYLLCKEQEVKSRGM